LKPLNLFSGFFVSAALFLCQANYDYCRYFAFSLVSPCLILLVLSLWH